MNCCSISLGALNENLPILDTGSVFIPCTKLSSDVLKRTLNVNINSFRVIQFVQSHQHSLTYERAIDPTALFK